MRTVTVLLLSLLLFLPGLIAPAAKAVGHPLDAAVLHHLLEGEQQTVAVFGAIDEDADCHDGFNLDPSQCAHAHMAMTAIPAVLPVLPDLIHPHFDLARIDVGHKITSAPPLRPPQA